jgi:methionyl-tRNA synthetase
MKRTLITSALPYANGYIHLGHAAGAYLPADIFARFLRLSGSETLYVCGSDEHGVAITIAAEKEGVSPKEIIDKYHNANKAAFDKFGMSFDIYSRTSLPEHHETAKEFFADFLKKGYLIEKEEEQFYDPKAKMFLPDRYVEGTCPNCGYDKARGDQCDKCGAYYNQLELKNPISLVSGDTPVVKKTTHWYMQFDKFQHFLEEYIEGHAKDWKDNVLQQTRSWLKQGLTERAITRDLSWGVKIDDIEGINRNKAQGKVLYVWFDAVLGYITATKIFTKENGKQNEWEKWWKDDDTRYIAFIGKDNIVFHTLIFPALLHAKNDGYILPDNVPANEFLNLEGNKFSKSRNWSIDLQEFIDEFPETNFIDALRYTLAMNFPETRDSDFTWKDFQSRNNNELADIVGNFINRTAHFINTKFDGIIPLLGDNYKSIDDEWGKITSGAAFDEINNDVLNENDFAVIQALNDGIKKIRDNYNRFRFRDAITETMNIARAANKYFNDEEPWKTAKSDKELCGKTLYVAANLIHSLAVLLAPVIPFTSEKLFAIFGETPHTGIPADNPENIDYFAGAGLPNIKSGTKITKPALLFSKIEDKTVEKQIAKLGDKEKENKSEKEPDNIISFDEVMKVKLRTAKIIEAEKIKKSKKLLKLQIDLGNEKRQIVAGIAEHYKPEDIVGKIIVVVANLQPAKLMGVESQGMLLAANTSDGKLKLVTLDDSDIELGAEVR